MRIGIVGPFNPLTIQDFILEPLKATNKTASSVNNLVLSYLKAGHQVCIFTIDSDAKDTKLFKNDNITLYVIGGRTSFIFFNYFPSLQRLARRIIPFIELEKDNLDVLHAHWCYQYALAAIPFANTMNVFCTIRDIAPVIFKNMILDWKPFHVLNKIYWAYKWKVFNYVLSCKEVHFIGNSEYTKNYFKARYPDRDISLIYNSIDESKILDVPKSDNKEKVFISIAADVDDKRKNIFTLIKAFSLLKNRYSDAKLLIVGHYRKEQGVYNKSKKYGLLNGVYFVGQINYIELLSVLDSACCMVHPALEETFGNTIIEAMARCIPVIGGNNSGAVPYILAEGKCGFVCDVFSEEDIYSMMLKVIEDKDKTKQVINNATLRLKEKYTNFVIGQQHIDLYKQFLSYS